MQWPLFPNNALDDEPGPGPGDAFEHVTGVPQPNGTAGVFWVVLGGWFGRMVAPANHGGELFNII